MKLGILNAGDYFTWLGDKFKFIRSDGFVARCVDHLGIEVGLPLWEEVEKWTK